MIEFSESLLDARSERKSIVQSTSCLELVVFPNLSIKPQTVISSPNFSLSIETDVDDNAFPPPTPPPRILLFFFRSRRRRDDDGDDRGDRDSVVVAHADDDVDTDAALALSDTEVGAGMDAVAVPTAAAAVLAVIGSLSAKSTRLSPLLLGAFKSGVCPTLVFFVTCVGVGEPRDILL